MQATERITAIEKRAAILNMSLFRLCKREGVDYSTLYRWRNDRTEPKPSKVAAHLGKLERALGRIEQDVIARVASARP